ncbi:MAG: accessory Sec system translocase SecA2, partial [Cyclobacteriaceae bacterium]
IMLVDELTGRIITDRKWQNGLQSAVEAKEGVPILTDGIILNSITIQHLIRLYQNYCGMTGTAVSASDEFSDLYGLGVFVIPKHVPSARLDLPDMIFTHRKAKLKAVIQEISSIHQTGQPILIGTLTVAESEELEMLLLANGLVPVVLNAKNDREEAAIIKEAGLPGAITISTNMAGRGTDIRLGGENERYYKEVVNTGGLYVLGTNKHESSRIDNQLRGRSGRQGDPGVTRFIVSMEDPLMVKYRLKDLLPEKHKTIRSDKPIHTKMVINEIARAQRIIEGQLFEIRKTLCEYTGFVESLRKLHYQKRNKLLTKQADQVSSYLLSQYDLRWSELLGEVQQLREGIAWERIAGRNPIREFITQCDMMYRNMELSLDKVITDVAENPELAKPAKRPTSTWTYVINDNPIGDPLTLMLIDASNIGMQIDPTAGIMLLLNKWFISKNK